MSKSQPSIAECDRILTGPGEVLEMEDVVIGGRRLRTWKNCPSTFRDYFVDSCEKYGDRTFLSSPVEGSSTATAGREEKTFKQVWEDALLLAGWMRSRGLGMGSKVAVGGGNSAGWITSFVAVQLIGGIAIALNAWLPLESLEYCLRLTEPGLVLCDARLASILDSSLPRLRRSKVGEVFCWSDLDHLRERPRYIQELRNVVDSGRTHVGAVQRGEGVEGLKPESDALIFFTSGTGGRPKAVLSTQRMALTNLWSGLVAPSRAALRAGLKPPPMPKLSDPQKVVLLAIPLFHVTGCLSWLMRAFFSGSKMVMLSKWDPSEAVRLIHIENVTVIGGVPAVVTEILESQYLNPGKSFETVFYGGAPPSKELAKAVKTRWPKAGLVQGYGLTETNAYVCSVAGGDYVSRPETTGPAVPVCDIKVVNPQSKEPLKAGEIGLLMVRGPQVMKCYYNDPEATARAADGDGWLDTGDVAMMDQEGFVYIKDRLKDIIIRGGENIASSDVENALYSHPAVLEAAAIGVPDHRLGEKVGAIVSLRADWTRSKGNGKAKASLTEVDLLEHSKQKLGKPAWPSIILVSKEQLPRNVNGKLVKKDLKPILVKEWERRKRVDVGRVRAKL